jgi:hypothetical protein
MYATRTGALGHPEVVVGSGVGSNGDAGVVDFFVSHAGRDRAWADAVAW